MVTIDDLQIKISTDASQAAKGLRDFAKGLRDAASDCSKAAKQMDEVAKSAKDVGQSTEKASDSTEKLDETAKETSKSFTKAGGLCEAVKKYAKDLQNTGKETDKATGKFGQLLASIKRIALYRAIRSAIKAITNALKEGFDMFVSWDRESNNGMAGAANAVDRLKEATMGLKGSLGALLGGIVTQLEPIITRIVGWITQLVDLIQMLSRALQGQSTYYKLVYKGAKAASGAAKELKRVLFGFDELNILPSKAGGGVSSDNGSWEYVEEPIRLLETLGELLPGLGLLTGGYIGLKGLLPTIINLFKKKNSSLSDQTSKVTADATATEGLATKLGMALGAASAFSIFLKKNPFNVNINKPALDFSADEVAIQNAKQFAASNPIEVKFNTTSDLTGIAQAAAGAMSLSALVASNPIVMSISAPFSQITSAFASLFNTLQRFFNNHPVKIPVAVAGGGMKGAGSYVGGLSSPVSNTTSVTAADVEAEIRNAMQTYESNLWDTGGTLGRAVAVLGGSALITAITGGLASIFSGGALGELFSLLGLAGAFAGGGEIPNTGSLFYAGEAGTEVVANMGHSTGVMNISQMQDAVANGNIEVVNAIYAMANMVTGAVNNKNFDVYMDASKVGQSVSKYQFNQARRGITQGAY